MEIDGVAGYWQRVTAVLSGAVVAQAIPIVGSLWIARLYVPAQFGVFAAWLGASMVLSLLLSGRLDAAFGLAEDGAPRGRLVALTVLLVIGLGGALGLLGVLLAQAQPQGLLGLPASLLAWLAPMGACAALSSVWQAWAANNGQVRILNMIRLAQALGVTGLQIALAWHSASALSLVLAQFAGTAIAVLAGAAMLPVAAFIPRNLAALHDAWKAAWRQYRRFPMLAMPGDMINVSTAQLPVIILGMRYGADVAGCFALATRTLGAPLAVFGGAVRDVFIRDAGLEMRAHGHCHRVYGRTFKVLALFSLGLVLATVAIAEPAFVLVFGEPWRLSGVMAIWLIPLFALRFVASPLSYTLYLAQKQDVDLAWQAALLALVLATLYLFDSYRTTLIAYGYSYAVMYVIYLMLSRRHAGAPAAAC